MDSKGNIHSLTKKPSLNNKLFKSHVCISFCWELYCYTIDNTRVFHKHKSQIIISIKICSEQLYYATVNNEGSSRLYIYELEQFKANKDIQINFRKIKCVFNLSLNQSKKIHNENKKLNYLTRRNVTKTNSKTTIFYILSTECCLPE